MGELIDDLLKLSRVSGAEIRREPVDLSEIVRAVGETLDSSDPRRTVTLTIEPRLVADADGRLMRVLFENLLGNAWKFTTKVDLAQVEFGVDPRATGNVYFVRDNGAGFDMAYAAMLFAPFRRLHREEEFPGTGIGLATVHRIIDRHGGRVWAEAAVGMGATVFFTLPVPRPASRSSDAKRLGVDAPSLRPHAR